MTSKAVKEQARVHIRWMIRRDMPEVFQIEGECFGIDATTEEEFLRQLAARNCTSMVAEHGEKVVGFMVYVLEKTCLDIVNFAVLPSLHRRGIGHEMAMKLIGKLNSHRRTKLVIRVPDDLVAAHLFFREAGFRAEGIERGEDGDIYKMVYRLRE